MRRDRSATPADGAPRQWGALARRGTRTVKEEPLPQGTDREGRRDRPRKPRPAEAVREDVTAALRDAEAPVRPVPPRPDKPRVAKISGDVVTGPARKARPKVEVN